MDHVCVHGHFYQPPRENPWTERVPCQPSAAPFHDWNARITEECYRPAGAARIRDEQGRILAVVNTYARISFDVGPTLLTWLDEHAPEVRDAMIAGDRAAVARFGHGTAMAQAYSHVILPLASPRDRRTQIRWALHDFEARFGRRSEGLWLPECAVDTPTLVDVAKAGVRFVILAPGQVAAVRKGGGTWTDRVDPNRAYRIELPGGLSIAAFVYDGELAQQIAFGGLLDSGDALYEGLRAAAARGGLAHTATDGESYGHHHTHGEMALAWAVHRIASDPSLQLVPYGRYLADHPPSWEARLVEGSSWSCAHGIERWRSDCGCGTEPGGGHWRAPLRRALDALAERLDDLYERVVAPHTEPWALRDRYIEALRRPDPQAWLIEAIGELDGDEVVRVCTALELQHQRLLMFASCGWFFADLAGIEPVQDLVYAWRAVELATRLAPDVDWTGPFRADLDQAHSNDAEQGTGADLLERRVAPNHLDLRDAAALDALHGLEASHRVQVEDVGVGRSGWQVERVRIEERRTGHAMRLGRAVHVQAGLAGAVDGKRSVPGLIRSLDADPGAWRSTLGWHVHRRDEPEVHTLRPSVRRALARLDAHDVRTALAVLDLAAHSDLNRAETYEVRSALTRVLAVPQTADLRWSGVRARASQEHGIDEDGLEVSHALAEWQAWRDQGQNPSR